MLGAPSSSGGAADADLAALLRQGLANVSTLAEALAQYRARVQQVYQGGTLSMEVLDPFNVSQQGASAAASARQVRASSSAITFVPGWVVPAGLDQDTGIQESAAAALETLGELEQHVQHVRAVVQAAAAVDKRWRATLAVLPIRARNSRSPLLQLPQEVLRTIALQVGADARLVCSHLAQAYGSPASGIRLGLKEADALHFIAALPTWPAPIEVRKLHSYPVLPGGGLRLAAQTFTQLRELKLATDTSHQYEALPVSLTGIKLYGQDEVTGTVVPVRLTSLSHLTALQSLTLRNVEHSPGSLQPLRALTVLTSLVLSDYHEVITEAEDPEPVTVLPPDAWGAFCALPRLQRLHLEIPLDLASPLPADASGLASLSRLWLDCGSALDGMAHPQLPQVLSLLPPGCLLFLQRFQSPYSTYPILNTLLLQQAFGQMSCRELHLQGQEPPSGLGRVLRLARQSLESLRLSYEECEDLNEVINRLVRQPFPALQSFSLMWPNPPTRYRTAPDQLLDVISGNMPALTHLHIVSVEPDTEVSTSTQDWQSFNGLLRLTALRSLNLLGFSLCALAANSLQHLPCLVQLSLCVAEGRYLPDFPCLPKRCSCITALTALTSLELGTPLLARTDTDDRSMAGQGFSCILSELRQLSSLRELTLGAQHSPSCDLLRQLLPLPPALTRIEVIARRKYRQAVHHTLAEVAGFNQWASCVRKALEGHGAELQLSRYQMICERYDSDWEGA